MFEIFESFITTQGNFTADELKLMRGPAIERKLRRRQLLLHEGEVCRHKVFVCKGLIRTYRLKNDGTENIMRFVPENCWNVDPQSYNSQTPTKYNIDALEDTNVILWSKESMDELFAAIPTLRVYSEKLKEHSLDATQNRVLANISDTAEEKYEDFITSYPEVFRRVPLHMVASYLGVSRETLSRIRHARLKRQKEF
jgi:CRP-like cAMP-binding protein